MLESENAGEASASPATASAAGAENPDKAGIAREYYLVIFAAAAIVMAVVILLLKVKRRKA